MTTIDRAFERTITAFLDGEDSPDIANPIHSTAVATEYGYRAALVGGVTVYGWCVPAITAALGQRWLEDGWIDVHFRRPTYPGDVTTARVVPEGDAFALAMTNQDGERCLVGTLGLGRAPFLGELHLPSRRTAEPRPATLPRLTPETAPVGQDLRPMPVRYSHEDAVEYATSKQADPKPPWVGEGARIHPGWLAARMTPMIHHSYDYGPAIHARSQIQHLAPALAGQTVTVAGHFTETYERKGHHYAVVDGVILAEDGTELAHLRHTTIYQVAKRGDG
jgi:acyl dehydratase